jgi:phosphoglycolate phosphatase-like HAD superfamily hydrolase
LFILSSNYEVNVRAFLDIHHLTEYFDAVYHCNVFNKYLAMRRIARKHHLDHTAAYYVGNEPGDIVAAQRTGVHGVAVMWSGQDPAVLEKLHPYKIILSPKELLTIN